MGCSKAFSLTRRREVNEAAYEERLGAHVSVQGGVEKAPVRGKAIGATAIQVFTKTPSQWREPGISVGIARRIPAGMRAVRAIQYSGA